MKDFNYELKRVESVYDIDPSKAYIWSTITSYTYPRKYLIYIDRSLTNKSVELLDSLNVLSLSEKELTKREYEELFNLLSKRFGLEIKT